MPAFPAPTSPISRATWRRAAEMREAAMMLDDLGMDGALSRAVADAQDRGAGKA